jgi:hypothetical protein
MPRIPSLPGLERINAHHALTEGLLAFHLTGSPLPALALLAAPFIGRRLPLRKDH